jgi:hypothetical protein
MSRALSQELLLQCIDARGRSLDLRTSFDYDPADPWAVSMTFLGPHDRVRWLVGRDLLLQGLTDPAGDGDISLWPSVDDEGRAAVVIELRSPQGRLVAQLLTNDLHRFLTRTLAAVPLGSEVVDVDSMIESLLGDAAG